MLALLDEQRSGPRTVANLALGTLDTHLDPAYRREGVALSGHGNTLRAVTAEAAMLGALVAVLGGLLALEIRHEQQTDGIPTAGNAMGIAVSSDMRLGVTAERTGAGGDGCCD